mmetsp:Transcript_390/g.749  ORF Transcript_390/g.749 Transcript_390/m.749 type:complete len:264 (+) Transcript_390:310-1101(+)
MRTMPVTTRAPPLALPAPLAPPRRQPHPSVPRRPRLRPPLERRRPHLHLVRLQLGLQLVPLARPPLLSLEPRPPGPPLLAPLAVLAQSPPLERQLHRRLAHRPLPRLEPPRARRPLLGHRRQVRECSVRRRLLTHLARRHRRRRRPRRLERPRHHSLARRQVHLLLREASSAQPRPLALPTRLPPSPRVEACSARRPLPASRRPVPSARLQEGLVRQAAVYSAHRLLRRRRLPFLGHRRARSRTRCRELEASERRPPRPRSRW